MHVTLSDFAIIADHSEPRQSVFYVMLRGQLAATFYSRADAIFYIEETTGEAFADTDED